MSIILGFIASIIVAGIALFLLFEALEARRKVHRTRR